MRRTQASRVNGVLRIYMERISKKRFKIAMSFLLNMNGNVTQRSWLEELGSVLTSLDPGDSIVIAKAFSHMLNLANLAEEAQIAYRRRIKLKKGDFADEANATTESDIEETLKCKLNKSPEEVFDALKNETVDLVLTAHPIQYVRRSLLQKHGRLTRRLQNL